MFLHFWGADCRGGFLVPKPTLGNALAGEAPASRDGRPEAGASGAAAFPSWGLGTRRLGNEEKFYFFYTSCGKPICLGSALHCLSLS